MRPGVKPKEGKAVKRKEFARLKVRAKGTQAVKSSAVPTIPGKRGRGIVVPPTSRQETDHL